MRREMEEERRVGRGEESAEKKRKAGYWHGGQE